MYHWLTRYSDETERMRLDADLEAPLGDDDYEADVDLFDRAFEGMTI